MSRLRCFVLAGTVALAQGCKSPPADATPPASSAAPVALASAPATKPVVLSGIAISAAGVEPGWSITFNEVENPEEAAQWAKGIRGFDFTATALPDQPEAAWRKVGPGDRVTFECTTREHVKELSGCKLTGFQDTSYALKPAK